MAAAKQKTTRDAKASRSSFRGPTKSPAGKTAKAKKQRAAAKATTKTKAAIASAAKTAATKARAKPKAMAPNPASTPTRRDRIQDRAEPPPVDRAAIESLGEVTARSGKLALFDIGLLGFLPREALEPAMIVVDAPADRPLPVLGTRVGMGRFADCWDHISIVLGEGAEITHARKLGDVAADFARVMIMDPTVLDHWVHEDSLDGKADLVFWGRDALSLARTMSARPVKEGYGWVDLALADAEAKSDKALRIKAENRWLLTSELRPHSHHHLVLAAARRGPNGAGTLVIGDATVCLVATSWGDGVFPVYLDLDGSDHPVRVRVQLATTSS